MTSTSSAGKSDDMLARPAMPPKSLSSRTINTTRGTILDTLDLLSLCSSQTNSLKDSLSTRSGRGLGYTSLDTRSSSVSSAASCPNNPRLRRSRSTQFSTAPSSPASALSTAPTEDARSIDLFCDRCTESSASSYDASENGLDFLELSDEHPTEEMLDIAGNINVYDDQGNARPFHSLYRGPQHQGQRQLIIFVRHFFCGACRAYLKALTETITPQVYFSLPIPTTITIIACGEASMIPQYATATGCPFRMYAEPTQKLYKLFGMRSTMNFGRKGSQEYVDDSVAKMVLDVAARLVVTGAKEGYFGAAAAGPIWQVGGEFLFEDGQPKWCHRMRNIRGHASMEILMKVLGMHGDDDSPWSIRKTSSDHILHSSSPRSLHSSPRSVKSSPKSAFSFDSKPSRGLQLIIDDSGEVPKAHLKRRSVTLNA